MNPKTENTLETLRLATSSLEVISNYFIELSNDSATCELKPATIVDALTLISRQLEQVDADLRS